MYGYPLTVYLLTGPLGGLVPGVDLSHNAGHLWTDLIGWKGDPHVSPFHLASYAFIIGGFWLVAAGWRVLFAAVKEETLATTGPYARLRHPQYTGLVLVMVGFLLQWPTLATLAMVGIVTSIVLSINLLPPRPPQYGRHKWIMMALQWVLLPPLLIFFGSMPALDAQSRLMLGKYMGFWLTPKHRKGIQK